MSELTFDEKIVKSLREMEDPVKGATAEIPTKSGGKYSYDYTTLNDVVSIVKRVLSDNGLFYRQCCDGGLSGEYHLNTYVTDGKQEKLMDIRPLVFGSDAQRNGAFETYSRRYALITAFGMCPEDTDAIETRGASMTSEKTRSAIQRGLVALKEKGVDVDSVLRGFEGWETDSRVAQRYLNAIIETFNQAKAVQESFPGTEIGA